MIEIKFNPQDPQDVENVKKYLGLVNIPVAGADSLPKFFADTAKTPIEPSVPFGQVGVPSTADAEAFNSAPAVTGVTSPAQTNEYYDAEGTPWDERIHSGNQSKTQAGVWTRRRNLSDEYFDRIRFEVRAGREAPEAPEAPEPAAPPPPRQASAPVRTPVAEVPAPPVATVPNPPQPDQRAPTPAHINPFIGLVRRVAEGQTAGKWTPDTISDLIESLSNPSIHKLSDFAAHHDAIPTFAAVLDSLG